MTILFFLTQRTLKVAENLSDLFDGTLRSEVTHLCQNTLLAGSVLTAEHNNWFSALLVVSEVAHLALNF